MNDCNTLKKKSLSPCKRVNYTFGMVLGEDDFRQEQAYHIGRRRLDNRALHGYGVVWGAKVLIEGSTENPIVHVEPALVINQPGQEICIPTAQCADLNAWLDRHREELPVGSPPGPLTLYVVLCSSECETDAVPIPGGPCRSQEDSMAGSRIQDHFKVLLKLSPPAQLEEDVVRRFGELLGRIEVTSGAANSVTPDEIANLVRSLLDEGSPPVGSPPLLLAVNPTQLQAVLHRAFAVWVTEVRPKIFLPIKDCACGEPDERCVLLARLDLDLIESAGKLRVNGPVSVRMDERPILLHTRLLQEWLLCHKALGRESGECATFATLFLLDSRTIRAWVHHPAPLDIPLPALSLSVGDGGAVPVLQNITQPVAETNVFDLHLDREVSNGQQVEARFNSSLITVLESPPRVLAGDLAERGERYIDRVEDELMAFLGIQQLSLGDLADVNAPSPANGDVLTRQGGEWVASPSVAGVTDHGDLSGLSDDDHQQYLLADGTRALTGDLSAGANMITNLRAAVINGEAVRFEQAVKNGDPAGGDLVGTFPKPQVAGLQGHPVSGNAPNTGDVLAWDGANWVPSAASGNFVTYLPVVESYAIVAAGIVRMNGSTGPVYNKLSVTAVAEGEVRFSFADFKMPTDAFTYIVKALAVIPDIGIRPMVTFGKFVDVNAGLPAGFTLNFERPDGRVPAQTLQLLSFMIEVSRYGLR